MERDQQPKKDDVGTRLLNRVGSVFRRGSRRTKSTVSAAAVETQPTIPEASASTSANPAPAATATATAAAATANTTTAAATPTPPPQQPQTSTAAVATTPARDRDTTVVIQWSQIQQERARALFAKYGLTLEPNEWMTPRTLEVRRVDKPIRMRVRRNCHRCQTTFGADKVCANCQHVRCKQCPRYPPARTKEEKEARALAKAQAQAAEISAEAPIAIDDSDKKDLPPLSMPSRTGGPDLIYKHVKQRIRRTCHRCQSVFQGTSTTCENCGHTRCKLCPRDPSKLDKYPDGYPGDEDPPVDRPIRVWKKPRMRVRYYCHQCDTRYIPGENTCANCGQVKGPESRRDPPKKVKPPIDPDVLQRVQERLQAIQLSQATEGDDT